LLDPSLAPSRGRGEELLAIVGRALRGKKADRRQAQRAFGEHPENVGEPPGRPRNFDAVVGRRLGEVQNLATVIEEGREAGGAVEAAAVELGQARDETGRGLLLAASERLQLRLEVLI